MSKRLFVGNLPFSLGQEELKKAFADYGDIEEAMVITNKFSGRSKGFGFITVTDDIQAEKAINEMNGKDVGGRQLVVNEARPLTEKKPEAKSQNKEA
jgi:RNA recognition motif-containing protein